MEQHRNKTMVYAAYTLVVLILSTHLLPTSTQSIEINYPEIRVSVISSEDSSSYELIEVSRNNTDFTLNFRTREFHYECISSYPNRWIISPKPPLSVTWYDSQFSLRHWSISKTRTVSNISGIISHTFISELSMMFVLDWNNWGFGHLKHNVACQHATNTLINTKLRFRIPRLTRRYVGIFEFGQELTIEGQAGGGSECNFKLLFLVFRGKTGCRYGDMDMSINKYWQPARVACRNPDECEMYVKKPAAGTDIIPHSDAGFSLPMDCDDLVYSTGVIICEAQTSQERCTGGIAQSLAQIYYIDLAEPPQIILHQDINSVPTERVLQITVVLENLSRINIVYVTEFLNFKCLASMSSFTQGIQWAVATTDGQINYMGSGTESNNEARLAYESQKKIEFNTTGLIAVICSGPVWNSYSWKNVSIEVDVRNPVYPYFKSDYENVTLTDGEQSRPSLSCQISGDPDPEPTLEWDKEPSSSIRIIGSELIFWNVTPSIADVYTCTAKSFNRSVTKTFHVSVVPRESLRDRNLPTSRIETNRTHGILEPKPEIASWIYIPIGFLLVALILILVSIGLFRQNRRLRMVLKDADIAEFRNGTGSQGSKDDLMIYEQPYNSKYEVNRKHIKIDQSKLLGKGEFGIVYKGVILFMDTLETVEVAVKTLRTGSDVNHMKSLLNELKVLTYLDNGHPNILRVLGANTKNIRFGEALVCVELCQDNMLSILSKWRAIEQQKTPSYCNIPSVSENVNGIKEDLLRWAYQVADGMEFLSLKRVVHGDLATRNVLISESGSQVKIADFGLGRIMENYKYITQDEHCPLPWKWMAIESLVERKFSSASDVWAFGVTIWEMFSLGNSPYPGLHWTLDFADQLKNGLRLQCPEFGSEQLYALQVDCWNSKPSDRPTFGVIKTRIADMLSVCDGYILA